MASPIVNPDILPGSVAGDRQERLWGVLGAMISFLGAAVTAFAYLAGAGPLFPFSLLAALGFFTIFCRWRHHSWAFAIGAFWGSIIPLAALVVAARS